MDPKFCDARKHHSREGKQCGSSNTASFTYIRVKNTTAALSSRPPVEPGTPGARKRGFPFCRRANLHVGGSHPPEGGDYRIAKCRLDVRVFQGCHNQAPRPRAFPQAKSLAPIGYSQIVKRVLEERAGRPFYEIFSDGIFLVHLTQNERG